MSEVCHDVSKEHSSQLLTWVESHFPSVLAIVLAWILRLLVFGVVGSNPLILMAEYLTFPNRSNPYRQHECAKHRAYKERVCVIEHESFSPLVFSASGGMGASTTVAYKRLAFLLSLKWKIGTCRLCSLLCYAALLKNFTYYAQFMLIDIEQFPDIYSSIPIFCR